jgi:gastric triacylglycerol lipase
MVTRLLLVAIATVVLARGYPSDLLANMTEYLRIHIYPTEEHIITTADGYKLKFFRIQAKGTSIIAGKPVVFLQHGILSNSDIWIINNERHAPALRFANEGYDVWIGNSRGNMHSRAHSTLNPDVDGEFWNFTWEDHALTDLPAAFEYIANRTGKKINYIGHSQGTLIMFAALSRRISQVVNHLDKFMAFAPICYMQKVSGLSGIAKRISGWINQTLSSAHIQSLTVCKC